VGVAFAEDTLAQGDGDLVADTNGIQDKIDNADDNGIIEMDANTVGSININKNITLNGNNHSIYRVDFKSSSDNLTVKNITFENIQSFEVNGNSLFDTCTFGKSNSEVNIKATGSTVFLNCNFVDMRSRYGGAVNATGNVTFIGCSFKQNEASIGGAVKTTGTATFIGCSFKQNYALMGGVIDSIGSLIITNSSFVGNSGYRVGVIYSHQKDWETGCGDIPRNEKNYGDNVGTVKISNSTFEDNFAEHYIGVIYSSNKLIIDNSTFRNNSATFMGVIQSTNDLTVRNSKFLKNKAWVNNLYDPSQGLISVINSIYGKTVITGSEFTDNVADYGTISLSFTNVVLSDNVFSNNRLGTIFVGDCTSKYPKYTILDDNLKAIKLFKLTAKNVVAYYLHDVNIVVKLTSAITSKPLSNVLIESTYAFSPRYISTTSGLTDKNGIASFTSPITGKQGVSTVNIFLYSETFWEGFTTTKITYTVIKIPTKVSAPKVTFKHKKSKYFKVTIKSKLDKKGVKGIKIKVKVYTGKKSKTYTLKTNGKGLAKLNTKKLKVGKHKVKISSTDDTYTVSGKSVIKIKK
jgi:hypothetical protein